LVSKINERVPSGAKTSGIVDFIVTGDLYGSDFGMTSDRSLVAAKSASGKASVKLTVVASRKASMKAIMKFGVKPADVGKMIKAPEMAYWPEMRGFPIERKTVEIVMNIDEDWDTDREAEWESIETRIIVNIVKARVGGNNAGWWPVNRLVYDGATGRLFSNFPTSVRLLTCLAVQHLQISVDSRGRIVLIALRQVRYRCRRKLRHFSFVLR